MRYTVIGLGQFGQELCTELSARNIEVVAVASTDEELEQIKDLVTYAVVTDYTNPAALKKTFSSSRTFRKWASATSTPAS